MKADVTRTRWPCAGGRSKKEKPMVDTQLLQVSDLPKGLKLGPVVPEEDLPKDSPTIPDEDLLDAPEALETYCKFFNFAAGAVMADGFLSGIGDLLSNPAIQQLIPAIAGAAGGALTSPRLAGARGSIGAGLLGGVQGLAEGQRAAAYGQEAKTTSSSTVTGTRHNDAPAYRRWTR